MIAYPPSAPEPRVGNWWRFLCWFTGHDFKPFWRNAYIIGKQTYICKTCGCVIKDECYS